MQGSGSAPSVEAVVARVLESSDFDEISRDVLAELKRAGDLIHVEDEVTKGKKETPSSKLLVCLSPQFAPSNVDEKEKKVACLKVA